MPTNAGINVSSQGKCELMQFSQLSSLPADVGDRLRTLCRLRSHKSNERVMVAGEHSSSIGLVADGMLRMEKTALDGRHQIVGLLVEGDIFGRVFGGPAEYAIEAATDATVVYFPRAQFESLLSESHDLERVVMLNLLNELDRARDWMLIVSSPKIRTRLAGFLMMLCTRFGNIDHILVASGGRLSLNIPITRADLASLLGTRAESISRAFHTLADAGTISIKQPNLIDILDIERLGEEAGEDFLESGPSLTALLRAVRRKAG